MRFTYSTHAICSCGQGQKCPKLHRKDGSWNSRHGSMGYAARIPTTSGTRPLKRYGFTSKTGAEQAARQAGELLALAADDETRAKIGDMIMSSTRRGGSLPAAGDVRRRLGLGQDPGTAGVTFGQAWAAWLAGKKRLRRPSAERLEQIGRHWLLPVLADVALERLNGGHCAAVFERIEAVNAAIAAAQADGSRAYPRVAGDARERPRTVGTASQHRVYAALRELCNHEVRRTHRLAFNPVYAVELEPEVTPEAQRWSAAEADRFIRHAAGDPLGLMFRVVVMGGARRAEACGFRWDGSDLDAGYLAVKRPVLLIGRDVVEGQPKSDAGKRRIWLDAGTIELLRAHRKAQLAARLRAGTAWQDHDLVFCQEDGTPWKPDHVSRRFRALAADAGVPSIKLHEGRHTSVSLARDAGVDAETRRKRYGHSTAEMSSHYTHIEDQTHRAAAESIAALVEGAGS